MNFAKEPDLSLPSEWGHNAWKCGVRRGLVMKYLFERRSSRSPPRRSEQKWRHIGNCHESQAFGLAVPWARPEREALDDAGRGIGWLRRKSA